MTVVEICVADVSGAKNAENGGADRVELCQALEIGGITPSHAFVMHSLEQAPNLGVAVMIRPRGGGFVYTADELLVMERDIYQIVALTAGVDRVGFAFTVLRPDGQIDIDQMKRLVDAAGGRRVASHKAFDAVPDQLRGLADLNEAGVRATLTSGGGGSALNNAGRIAQLVANAPDGFEVIAAGGVRADHVAELVRLSKVSSVHLEASKQVSSDLQVASEYDAGFRKVTSSDLVAEVVQTLAD